jgi:hypothetical protein
MRTGAVLVVVSQGVTEFIDTNGYTLRSASDLLPVPAHGDSILFDSLAADSKFTVFLEGLAPDCWTAAPSRSMTVVADSTRTIRFVVHCATQWGAIQVVTSTRGINIPVGPHTMVQDGWRAPIGHHDTLLLKGLPGAVTEIALEGATAGCWPTGGTKRSVPFPAPGQVTTLEYDIPCGVILYHGFPDGSEAQFFHVNVVTNETRPLATMHTNAQGFRQSPTGDQVAFHAFNMIPNGNIELWLMSPDAKAIRTVMQTTSDEVFLNWDPNGREIWYSDWGTHSIRRADVSSGLVAVIPRVADREYMPAPRPQGDIMAYTHEVGHYAQVWLMSRFGAERRNAFPVDWFLSNPSWSPSGDRLVVSGLEDWTGDRIKLFVGAPGTVPAQITHPVALMSDGAPQWSMDGEWIAFVRYPNADWGQLWLVRPDGSGLHRIPIPVTWNGDFGWIR